MMRITPFVQRNLHREAATAGADLYNRSDGHTIFWPWNAPGL